METRKQAGCSQWFDKRKDLITASNFGRFMIRKVSVNNKFLDSIYKSNFTSKYTTHGNSNEIVAKQLYLKKKNVHVHDCGLVINPHFPFLYASPEGKICERRTSGILEIKCPYIARDHTLEGALEDDVLKKKVFFEREGEEIRLEQDHEHWYQVQGQLLVTGSPFYDFVTYTYHDLHVERIYPNQVVMSNILEKLTKAYIDHVSKYLKGI